MHFSLVDQVLEVGDGRIVTLKSVSSAEEYLQDHFPRFPVLPGVFMLEAMVQAARELLRREGLASGTAPTRWVLGEVKGVKYGNFVKPGDSLRVEVSVDRRSDGAVSFKGSGLVVPAGGAGEGGAAPRSAETAVAGRFTMRPLQEGGPATFPPVASAATVA